jgi:hypothetical protein
MPEYDNKAFNAMRNATRSKADNLTKKFDLEAFYEKGDSLYSVYANKTPQYDPRFPDISMFDEGGQETPEYKQAYTDAGEIREVVKPRIGMTPRQSYFRGKFRELEGYGDDPDIQKMLSKAFTGYGDFMEPKYTEKDKLISPYKAAKVYSDMTSGKDWKEIIDFETGTYEPFLKGLKTK